MRKKIKFTIFSFSFLSLAFGISSYLIIRSGLSKTNNESDSEFSKLKTNFESSFSNAVDIETNDSFLEQLTSKKNIKKDLILDLKSNKLKQGSIFFLTTKNKLTTKIKFNLYTNFRIKIILDNEYKNLAIKDLKIFNSDFSRYILAKPISLRSNTFQFQFPKYEDTIEKNTNNSWFYNLNTKSLKAFKIRPTFEIDSNIVTNKNIKFNLNETNFDTFSYQLKANTKWSVIQKQLDFIIDTKKFKNLSLYIYLNGFNLILDQKLINFKNRLENVEIHFHNYLDLNLNNKNRHFGKIAVIKNLNPAISNHGSLYFGPYITYKYFYFKDELRFLDFDDKNVVGAIENNPNKN